MALPLVQKTSVIEIVAEGFLLGQQTMNVFHYAPVPDGAADTLVATLQHMLQAFRLWWIDNILTQLVTDYTTIRYFCRELGGTKSYTHPGGGDYVSWNVLQFDWMFPSTAPDPGDVEGDPIPSFNATNFYFSTLINGKQSKGGKRIPGLYKAAVEATDGNLLTNPVWANMKAAALTCLTPIGLDNNEFLGPCLLHKTAALKAMAPVVDLIPYRTPWASCTAQRAITSQTSRRIRARIGT